MTDLRKLLAAARPSPWRMSSPYAGGMVQIFEGHDGDMATQFVAETAGERSEADAALIAAAVNALPLLLDLWEAAGRYVALFGPSPDRFTTALGPVLDALAALEGVPE